MGHYYVEGLFLDIQLESVEEREDGVFGKGKWGIYQIGLNKNGKSANYQLTSFSNSDLSFMETQTQDGEKELLNVVLYSIIHKFENKKDGIHKLLDRQWVKKAKTFNENYMFGLSDFNIDE